MRLGYAFAQSVKLAVFEKIVDAALVEAKPIPEALAQHGTFDLDEKLVKMQMGAIFVTKCSMTLQSDMLGTPEILWEHDRFDAQLDARKNQSSHRRCSAVCFAGSMILAASTWKLGSAWLSCK
ncbi:sif2 [Symbiodinium pilosum]|uniref:Sif2 protein n=1 Tax=Symbiodinium pilosum TaxID=2952 RepID=A0A812U963_SYMPI|nr:sif2 [Symbiodinium pilosum]